MQKKSFSIIKAFEFSFDAIIHHTRIFLQLIVLMGLSSYVWHSVEHYYLAPFMHNGLRVILKQIRTSEIGKKWQLNKQCASSETQKFTGILQRLLCAYDTTISTQTHTEAIKPSIEHAATLLNDSTQKSTQSTDVVDLESEPETNKINTIVLGILAGLLSFLVYTALTIFSLRLALDFYDFHTIRVTYALHAITQVFWTVFASLLLYHAISILGLLILIIPGIIVAIRYFFATMLIVDEKTHSVRQAFSLSALCTEGVRLHLLGFFIIVGIINSFTTRNPWISLLTVPLLYLWTVYIFRKILAQTVEAQQGGHA